MGKTTKIFIFSIVISLFGMVFLATPALSKTNLLFSTLTVKVEEGEIFNLAISIDPKGVKNYTVKVELDYPANLLTVTSFNFSPGWMQIPQPGYDLIDNTKGIMIKTAGYPGGFSTKKTFGTVSFSAKKKGSGFIKVGGSSFVLDAENQNVLSDAPIQVSVAITEKIVPEEVVPEFEIPEEIPEGYTFEKNLSPGDTSIDVAYLQICLTSEGVYSEDITGYFGSLTKKAVIDLQEKYFDDILAPWGFEKGTGLVNETTRAKLNEVCFVPVEEIPEQLFDINLEIDEYSITDIQELTSRVMFTSFGIVPTPVNLTFTILDDAGEEVYSEKDYIVVETEAVLTKKFEDIELLPGKYTLLLDTLYNVDVRDEFRQEFEIIELVKFWETIWFKILVLLVIILVILLLVGIRRKKLKQEEQVKGR